MNRAERTRRSDAGQTRRRRRQWRTEADKNVNTTNTNLGQGETADAVHTATSYFDPGCNAFAQQTDGSMQWISAQIVGIGEDFHSQVDDGKEKTTLYKLR